MENNKKKGSKHQKLNIFILLFTGFLLCYMVTMMYIGGFLNIREFLSAGRVYDFSEKELSTSSRSWQYSEEDRGYWIQKQKALNKWKLDGSQSTWSYLYLDVDELSVPSVETHLYYLNKSGERAAEQVVWLVPGENVIILQHPDVGMYEMGMRLYGISGQFISIGSMQLREEANGFFMQRFIKIMAVSYTGFLAACGLLWYLKRRFNWKYPSVKEEKPRRQWLGVLQYTYQVILEDICIKVYGRTTERQRQFWRRILFCLLFLGMVIANLAGWSKSQEVQRYYMLAVSVVMLLLTVLMWEKPLCYVNWKKPLNLAWICLWVGTLLADCFISPGVKGEGIVMLLACGSFVFLWNNRIQPEGLLYEMLQALEIDFGIAVLYCMFFRTKKLTIRYNGIFNNSEHFSMYAVLMLAVFLAEIDWLLWKKKNLGKAILYVTGAALSFYFVLRAANESGYIAAAAVLLIFGIRQMCRRKERGMWGMYTILRYGIIAGVTGFLCVSAVHFSTKYLPSFLGTEIEYSHENLISNVSPEVMTDFEALQPGLMDGVKSSQETEYGIKWKNYVRRLGLIGSDDRLKVNRGYTTAYNGYIQMAYRYGIFILLPYVVLQICMAAQGVCGLKQKKQNMEMWMFMVTVIFICFCILGNVENVFSHPLWFCYYVGMGYWFDRQEGIREDRRIGNKIEKSM